MTDISERIEQDKTRQDKRRKRESGSGCLIPPRIGVTQFWSVQVRDLTGKLKRSSAFPLTGLKVRGELKADADPKLPESWSNLTQARLLLKAVSDACQKGDLAVGNDPTKKFYSDLRALYLQDYKEQDRKSLRTSATGIVYVDTLTHLDTYFGYVNPGDKGMKVSHINGAVITKFKNERMAAGAANATVNRALAALRKMFTLACDDSNGTPMLTKAPSIKMLPEDNTRTGFLELEGYEKLYAALGVEVINVTKNTETQPYAYIQPLLQTGFYTGMRFGEIINLKWSCVDLKNNVIRLGDKDVKNKHGREIPLIDGLPGLLEKIKQQNPKAEYVFLRNGKKVGSIRKAWRLATKAAGMEGLLFHDLRRSALRNLIRAGIPQSVAKKITGHLTDSTFDRYNITNSTDIQNAGGLLADYLKKQAAEIVKPATKLRVVNG